MQVHLLIASGECRAPCHSLSVGVSRGPLGISREQDFTQKWHFTGGRRYVEFQAVIAQRPVIANFPSAFGHDTFDPQGLKTRG